MLKLSSSQRKWLVLALVAWLIILVGLIFIPQSRPADSREAEVAPTNSLTTTMQSVKHTGGASVAQLVNPARVYDENKYSSFTSLCPNDTDELKSAKMQALKLDDEPDLGGDYGYMVLLPTDENAPVMLDQVALKDVDICTITQDRAYPLENPLPFYYTGDHWELGINQ